MTTMKNVQSYNYLIASLIDPTKMTSSVDTKLSMKLLIDTKADKVIFGEAEKNCVDFLLHILSLPVSTVIRLLNKEGMTGSLPNLYNSVENMNDAYIQSKDILLKPKSSIGTSSVNPFLLLDDVPTCDKTFYGCCNTPITTTTHDVFSYTSGGLFGRSIASCSMYITEDPDAICPCCRKGMSKKFSYIVSDGVKGVVPGFVKESVTYMVMDDLVVQPMSPISIITLLNKFKVKDVGVLQEKVVNFGMKEALKMLRASFESKTVLTNVFLSDARTG